MASEDKIATAKLRGAQLVKDLFDCNLNATQVHYIREHRYI